MKRVTGWMLFVLVTSLFSGLFASEEEVSYPPATPIRTEAFNAEFYTEQHLPSGVPLHKRPTADHRQFSSLKKEFYDPEDVTKACLKCHTEAGKQILQTSHWLWGRTMPAHGNLLVGKRNVINNFCISSEGNEKKCMSCHIGYNWNYDVEYDFKNQNNIDCLICHEQTGQYAKAAGGKPKLKSLELANGNVLPAPSIQEVAQSVGRPARHNCGYCHFNSGGGDGVKHGDLDSSMYHPDRNIDVHMAEDGANLVCVDCHRAPNHHIQGQLYTVSGQNRQRVLCTQCHDKKPHKNAVLDSHTKKLSCQACHIPIMARKLPTKTFWDWSTAGRLSESGEEINTVDENGHNIYMSKKGSFLWESKKKPDYIWFNGTGSPHLRGTKIDPSSAPILLNPLGGSSEDPDSKIIPVKTMHTVQPYDPVNNILITPFLYGKKDSGAFWRDFDFTKAARLGMEKTGLPFSGNVAYVQTTMYWPLNHQVAPKEQALKCDDCHSNDGRLKNIDGVYIAKQSSFSWIDTWVKIFFILACIGILLHGLFRIFLSPKHSNEG